MGSHGYVQILPVELCYLRMLKRSRMPSLREFATYVLLEEIAVQLIKAS